MGTSSVGLQPYARVLRRSLDSAQVGLVCGEGVVLSGLAAADFGWLAELVEGVELEELRRQAGPDGVRLEALLERLRDHRLLVEGEAAAPEWFGRPRGERLVELRGEAAARGSCYAWPGDAAEVVARREYRHVVVHGHGLVADRVVDALREAGIGRVTSGGGVSLHDLAWRAGEASPPDAVVLVASGAVSFEAAEPWRRRGVPHLPVVVDGHRLMVGPWVSPEGPCLTCLDLHRTDRDPAWPHLLRQLSGAGDVPTDADAALRMAAAGMVAATVGTALDGVVAPEPGVATEVALPLLAEVRHRWSVHPRCRCEASRGTMVA